MQHVPSQLAPPLSKHSGRKPDAARHGVFALSAFWLLALVALTLVPRLVMAWKIDVLCPDGVVFIAAAEALEQGDRHRAFEGIGVNAYPVILMVLHRAGLDWELAGKIWGVAMSTLTLLPLLGWVRRSFDDRVALVAGFLYAVHPKLIEWSPELIRDQTFWFLAMSVLYCAWRAASEVRLGWFVLAACALVAALYTRFEAWFLLVPLVLWTVTRTSARPMLARRALGLATAALVVTTLVVWTETTWAAGGVQTSSGPFARLTYVTSWLKSLSFASATSAQPQPAVAPVEQPPAASAAPVNSQVPAGAVEDAAAAAAPAPVAAMSHAPQPPISEAAETQPQTDLPEAVMATSGGFFTERMKALEAVWYMVHTLVRGLNFVYLALLIVAAQQTGRAWIARDQLAMLLVSALVLVGIWIHLWNAQVSSSRYALLIVLVTLPYAAIGLLAIASFAAERLPRLANRRALTAAIFAVVALVGLIDAWSSREIGRRREAALGEWLLATYGRSQPMITTGHMNVLAYYGQNTAITFPSHESSARVLGWLEASTARIMVLSAKRTPGRLLAALTTSEPSHTFRAVARERIPVDARDDDLIVFERVDHVAQTSGGASAIGR